ncbi:bcl-2-binding component 3-like [Ailuropoda melanoleuca]|uniref:bcl-2-binding component 3-like n=1 Tax=Ailuropoda melanoleuca TaxID=9646 RepID=UPI0014945C50|nr:bcl-2-binding component 3-like [Ailuropoda melanoleuca]
MSMQGLPGHVPSAARGFLLALSTPPDLWQEWSGVPASECVPVSGPVPRDPLQAPGSAMARARQEGSSPEPVEGLARDGPRPFPLSRLVPSAVSCGLCEPGLPAAPAAPALLPAAYLCDPV